MRQHDLGARAEDNLRFIRHTMERSTRFTAVSGWGGVAMGAIGVGAALLAAGDPLGSPTWILTWLSAAALAGPLGAGAMWWKSERTGVKLAGAAARKFALCFFPVVVAGVVVTWTLVRAAPAALPAAWLSLYGAAVMAGGAFSVSALPLMGGGFLALGALAGLFPEFGGAALLLGFGVLQIGFGAWIGARHDG